MLAAIMVVHWCFFISFVSIMAFEFFSTRQAQARAIEAAPTPAPAPHRH